MKKLLSFILTLIMTAVMAISLTACGGGGVDPNKPEEGDVVLSFLHIGTRPKAMDEVEAKLSEICKAKLGFGVKFKEVNVMELNSTYSNWLAANEEIDLLNVFGGDPVSYINDKKVREMSSLMTDELAPHLKAKQEEMAASYLYGTDDKLYGIGVFAPVEDSATSFSYVVRKDVLETLGLADKYTNGTQISYEDLNTIFDGISKNYKTTAKGAKIYPCPIINFDAVEIYFSSFDPLGANQYPMGVMMLDPVTGQWQEEVVNYYETEQYKNYVNWIGSCKEKGWIHPDAETTSSTHIDLFEDGQFLGVFLQNSASIKNQWEDDNDCELVQLPINRAHTYLTVPMQALMISSKSTRPKRAMQVMNLLYEDVYFNNVIYYGIEGKQWKYMEGGKEYGYITEVAPGSRSDYMVGGFWGDYSSIYKIAPDGMDLQDAIARETAAKAYNKSFADQAQANKSPAWGFSYDSTKQQARINALNNKLGQYVSTLRVGNGVKGSDGTYTGPGSTYAEMIAALNQSKINLVIQNKAEQYNAWKANK